ncbi:MAG: AMP-binding protein [Chromatiales bacterium]|jgi:bile acid-coenzyme A ligase|nr:AMP-binding protein [Chromatiales bacterium]
MTEMSYSRRLSGLAQNHPDAPMLTMAYGVGEPTETLTWGEVEARSNRLAHALKGAGITRGDYITIALPNGFDFVMGCIAAWKIGATPQPVSARLPSAEMDAIVELAGSRAVLGVVADRYPGRLCVPVGEALDANYPETPIEEDYISPAWKAPTSGGSTGRPKLIVSSDPSLFDPDELGFIETLGFRPGGTTLVPGPLYHNGPFIWTFSQLLLDGHVVMLRRFEASATIAALALFKAEVVYLVPTMMSRIWKLPIDERTCFDLSALEKAWHLAAPCPEWLKRAWIDWLGAERVWELYGGTEAQSATVISGEQWLERPGSVGQAATGELRIMDDDGAILPAGVTGEVYMRPEPGRSTYFYKGAEPRRTADGWESLGDMGYLDEDGFLFLADRRSDMILTGGANVYPAEIEAAIDAHPLVSSSAVIGMPDEDLGQRVHAIVQAASIGEVELSEHLADQLVRYKIPRTFEFVDTPLRDDAGKVRRSALLADRLR